jgi:hypothetical protein
VRSEPQIHAMRDRVHRNLLINGGEMTEVVLTIFDWIVYPHTPDGDVIDLADGLDPDQEYEPRLEDLAVALIDAVSPSTLPATQESLNRMAPAPLAELAATARKLDRLCKAEVAARKAKEAKK